MGVEAIFLENPKWPFNVGGVVRAAAGFNVGGVFWSGDRVHHEQLPNRRLPREERTREYGRVHRERVNSLPFAFPRRTYVAVEILPGTESLMAFEHPEDAVYVFGPEDGTLSKETRARCHRFVVIPTEHCMNLAVAVNVVLYDRLLKDYQAGRIGPFPTSIVKDR